MTGSGRYRLGIDLGGSKIFAALLEGDTVIAKSKKATKPERGYEAVLQRIVTTAKEACDEAGITLSTLESFGIGVPGPVRHNELLEAPNLGWQDKPLAADLQGLTQVRSVLLGNDVNCGALGEALLGAGKGNSSVFALFAGTGLGGGFVVDGKVFEGASGFAGEVGHMQAPGEKALCSCGQTGCLETVASKKGLTIQFKAALAEKKKCAIKTPEGFKSRQLEAAYRAGCPTTVAAIEAMAKQLAWAMNTIACVINPDCFVLGGGIGERLGQDLLPMIASHRKKAVFVNAHGNYSVVTGSLGGMAVALGAAELGLTPGDG